MVPLALDEPVPLVEVEPGDDVLMVVVVVVVLTVVLPGTHWPPDKISPSLLEHVLHPTPPSLKLKGNEPTGQAATH